MDILAGLSFFWIGVIFAAFILAAIIALSTRSFGWAFIVIVSGLAVSHLTSYSAFYWLQENWWLFTKIAVTYIAVGLIWATFAWFLHRLKVRSRYDAARTKLLPRFLEEQGATELTPALRGKFREYMEDKAGRDANVSATQTQMSKGVMVEQVVLWPFKLIGFFLGDAIRHVVDLFLSLFGGVFSRINKWVFRNYPELNA